MQCGVTLLAAALGICPLAHNSFSEFDFKLELSNLYRCQILNWKQFQKALFLSFYYTPSFWKFDNQNLFYQHFTTTKDSLLILIHMLLINRLN